MFDIGFPELLLIAIVGLLVLGPERLPVALRAIGLWLGRAQRSYASVKAQIEKEVGMEDVHRQLRRELMDEKIRLHQAAQPVSPLEPEIAARQQRVAEVRGRVEAQEPDSMTGELEGAEPDRSRQTGGSAG
jgi:sec-independent protein translocase protein TatB